MTCSKHGDILFVHKEAINSVFFFFFFPPAFGDHRIGIVRDFEGPLAAAAGVVESCDDADRNVRKSAAAHRKRYGPPSPPPKAHGIKLIRSACVT